VLMLKFFVVVSLKLMADQVQVMLICPVEAAQASMAPVVVWFAGEPPVFIQPLLEWHSSALELHATSTVSPWLYGPLPLQSSTWTEPPAKNLLKSSVNPDWYQK